MPLTPLPTAWIEGIGPLLVVVFWVIQAIYRAINEQKEVEQAREAQPEDGAPPAGRMPPRQVVEGPGGQPPEGDLRSEIDEFLKRVSEEFDPEPVKEAKAAPAPELIDAEPRPRAPLDPFEEPPRRPRRLPKVVVPTNEPKLDLTIDSPAIRPEPEPAKSRQELRRLPESQLAEQAAHLGERIAGADDRVEARLHEKFDHKLGKLGSQQSAVGETKPEESLTGAQRIKALLARPGGVREAIVLSEILRRPSDPN